MPITEWYLNVRELPNITQASKNYVAGLIPHQSTQWELKTPEMKEYKRELLEELYRIQDARCVYCGLGMERTLVDREHFVAKGKKGKAEFMFHPSNLFAACAFCNRRLKGQTRTLKIYNSTYSLCVFKIVHPYHDDVNLEMEFLPNTSGHGVIVSKLTDKGLATIKLFELDSTIMTAKRAGFIIERETIKALSAPQAALVNAAVGYRPT